MKHTTASIGQRLYKTVRTVLSRLYERCFRDGMALLSREERESFLHSFPEPKDCFERSFFQYRCHMKSVPLAIRIVQNTLSLLALPVLLLFCRCGKQAESQSIQEQRAVYISDGLGMEIVPVSLQVRFPEIVCVDYSGSIRLDEKDRKWLKGLFKRYWRFPHFMLKCTVKTGLYSQYIRQYCPAAFIVYNEYAFSCSVLTDYCTFRGVEHINVLHGERMYNLRDAFVSFHRFYVWDEYYRELFVAMRAEPLQFAEEIPPLFDALPTKEALQYDLTYYLGNHTREQMERIYSCFIPLQLQGYKLCVRLHPRYQEETQAKEVFNGWYVESPNNCTPSVSLAKTRRVCGLGSSVLYQAQMAGKTVILDDVSNPDRFALHRDLGYIILKRPHILLSTLVEQLGSRRSNMEKE